MFSNVPVLFFILSYFISVVLSAVTLSVVVQVVAMAPDDPVVRESVIHCFGDLSNRSDAISAISDPQVMELMRSTVAQESDSYGIASTSSIATTVKNVRMRRCTTQHEHELH